jgi:hypothetical protein
VDTIHVPISLHKHSPDRLPTCISIYCIRQCFILIWDSLVRQKYLYNSAKKLAIFCSLLSLKVGKVNSFSNWSCHFDVLHLPDARAGNASLTLVLLTLALDTCTFSEAQLHKHSPAVYLNTGCQTYLCQCCTLFLQKCLHWCWLMADQYGGTPLSLLLQPV